MTTKRSEEYLFHLHCKEMSTNSVMASRFRLAAYILRLFESHFSLVYFSRLKYKGFACSPNLFKAVFLMSNKKWFEPRISLHRWFVTPGTSTEF